MLRLIFWLLFGDRRPLLEDIRHLSSPIIQRAAMTALLHAHRKEDFILVQQALQVIIDRFDARRGQGAGAQEGNVTKLPTNGQQTQHNNNQRR